MKNPNVCAIQVSDEKKTQGILPAALNLIDWGLKVAPFKDKQPFKVKSVNDLRDHPINKGNAEFYFREAPQLAILTGENLEMIDIDLKYDVTGSLEHNVLTAIEYSLPDVFSKLVIERTVNGGLHIYYRCDIIESNKKLAQRKATPDETQKGEKTKVLIETRGEKGCAVCCPTPGYQLIQNDFTVIPNITTEERLFIHAICRSFDESATTVAADSETRNRTSNQEAPWHVFNRHHDYTWMLEKLLANGFIFVCETDECVFVLRSGSTARTSGKIFKKSNLLYLFSTSTQFIAEKAYTAFDVLCTLDYNENKSACAQDLSAQGFGKWESISYSFWEQMSTGKIRVRHSVILQWLHDKGYRKFRRSIEDFSLVRINGRIVEECSLDHLKKEFCTELKYEPEGVQDHFLSIIGKLLTKDGLLSQLDACNESEFLSSNVNSAWVFYRNTALKITPEGVKTVEYGELPGLIWMSRIIDRNFIESAEDGMTKEFIKLIGTEKNESVFRRAIGYLLHSYKDPTDPRVIILNDPPINYEFEAPRGGTGKGLFIQLLARFRNTYKVDGKIWKAQKNFPYQGVSWDTELIAFEDVVKGFDFESLFSVITDGMVIEKKGKDEFRIPFSRSPKMLITTNYAIPGTSSSHARRRLDLVLEPLFSHSYTPYDHFGKRFFDEWDEQDWQAFDNYMVNCVQLFVRQSLPAFELNRFITAKEVMEATSADFYRWIEHIYWGQGLPERIEKEAFLSSFAREHQGSAWGKSEEVTGRFTRWLNIWSKFRGIRLDATNRHNGEMAYRFYGNLSGTIVDER